MTTRNEAAERLREWILEHPLSVNAQSKFQQLDEALAAERRAGRRQALGECMCEKCEPEWTAMVLDEEAAR